MSPREPRGLELFLDLLGTAQVLIENFRPGTLAPMGLAPKLLHRRKPPQRHGLDFSCPPIYQRAGVTLASGLSRISRRVVPT